jgi:cyclopropane fatty-acyl-phospholipid synthase-like methyltransferase
MKQENSWKDTIIDTPNRRIGPRASFTVKNDPRRLVITLSRYKFCSKILSGKNRILEVGCGDAFGTPLVAQDAGTVSCIDIDPKLIEGNKERMSDFENISFNKLDITHQCPEGRFDGAYSLDVLEHIPQQFEDQYFTNVCKSLNDDAIFIVGVPNITSDKYASKPGHSPHVNLKDEAALRKIFNEYFVNTLIFSMNDEVVHTGFTPMAHYLFSIGIGLKK